MTVTVYIWYPEKENSSKSAILGDDVGHTSIEIKTLFISNYISHRPLQPIDDTSWIEHKLQNFTFNIADYKNFDFIESAVSQRYTYEQECVRKRRTARKISLNNLNEIKMWSYYFSYIKNCKYHLVKNNCSTVVANIIKASLDCLPKSNSKQCTICSFQEYRSLLKILNNEDYYFWTPKLIEKFVLQLKEQPRKLCLARD